MFLVVPYKSKATGVSFRNKSVKLSRLSVADPDLQIRGGPLNQALVPPGGGRGQSQKKFFQPLGPQFGLKIRGSH